MRNCFRFDISIYRNIIFPAFILIKNLFFIFLVHIRVVVVESFILNPLRTRNRPKK